MHCYCAPHPNNPTVPSDGTLGENAVHWCDIDQPYANLPEPWKATNRQYTTPEIGDLVHWCDIDQPYANLPESWKAANRQHAAPQVGTTAKSIHDPYITL